MWCSYYSRCDKRGRTAPDDFGTSLFVNKITPSPPLMEKLSCFPATRAKYPPAGIPSPLRRPVLWITKARWTPFHIFMSIHLHIPTSKKKKTTNQKNNKKPPQLKKKRFAWSRFSTFTLMKPIKRTRPSLASKPWISGFEFQDRKPSSL